MFQGCRVVFFTFNMSSEYFCPVTAIWLPFNACFLFLKHAALLESWILVIRAETRNPIWKRWVTNILKINKVICTHLQTATHSERMLIFPFWRITTESSHLWPASLPSYGCVFAIRAEMAAVHIKHHSMYPWRRSQAGLKTVVAPHRLLQSREATSRAVVLVLQLQPDISWTSCTCCGKTSLSASNVKSTALYHYTKECEWRIKITKLTGIPQNGMEK